MEPHNDQIKKTVGKSLEKSPLQKLKEINTALKKMGCKDMTTDSETVYRKIVGKR